MKNNNKDIDVSGLSAAVTRIEELNASLSASLPAEREARSLGAVTPASEQEYPRTISFLERTNVARDGMWIDFAHKLELDAFRMRIALEEIARLDTGQLASGNQCCAVAIAMDALALTGEIDRAEGGLGDIPVTSEP